MNVLQQIDLEQMRFDMPDFRPGDTVKVHIRNLLKKLKFRSRVEAAVWAVAHGLG